MLPVKALTAFLSFLDRLSNAVAKKKVVAVNLNDYGYGEIAQWSHDDYKLIFAPPSNRQNL